MHVNATELGMSELEACLGLQNSWKVIVTAFGIHFLEIVI